MSERKCDKCQVDKSLEDFPPNSNGKLGRSNVCKKCKNQSNRERRARLRGVTKFDAVKVEDTWFKKCNMCLELKVLTMFSSDDRALKSTKGTKCEDCCNAWRRENNNTQINKIYRDGWKERDPAGYAESSLRRRVKRRFKLTPEEYHKMRDEAPDKCSLCNRDYGIRGPVIDHDHSCCPGRKSCGACIRGVICNRCNTSLGLIDDNRKTLDNMIFYLTGTS